MSDLSRMWFRLTGSGSSTEDPSGSSIASKQNSPVFTRKCSDDGSSKFDKFRRASFRRKSSTPSPSSGKRSMSPKFLLKQQSTSLDEFDEMEEKEILPLHSKESGVACLPKTNSDEKTLIASSTDNSDNVSLIPLSDPKTKSSYKKPSLKSVKNSEAGKKKFYKNFYSTKSLSQDQETLDEEKAMAELSERKVPKNVTIFPPNSTSISISALAEDDDDDDDDSDSDGDMNGGANVNAINAKLTITDNLPHSGKEKILLTDRKFRNNRIEKSSSKTKIADLDKKESIKRSRSNRKIYQAPALVDESKVGKKSKDHKEAKKSSRTSGNLNFQALVKFVVNNKKFLNTDDFNLIRRKSLSEAASAVIQVAATCKPLPIALKYPTDSVVAETPKENDPKGERNVVLVKKQPLNNNNCAANADSLKPPVKERKSSSSISSVSIGSQSSSVKSPCDKIISAKVKRNSSNSSKSSGNFEDEAFYSCDEVEEQRLREEEQSLQPNVALFQSKHKSSSPSLTSRVAAKINETTNNYKNRKAANKNNKKRKNLTVADASSSANPRPEFYKQLSVERLNSTSIQRHPSDRRTDGANISIRSNGNTSAHLNASDLQNSFNATDVSMGAVGGSQAGADINLTAGGAGAGVSTGVSGALCALNDINAQDASESNLLRRERLHQQHQQNKSAPVSVNRSESYKERLSHKRNRSQRKTSDPNLTSRPNDDQPDLGLSNSNFTASSNSSLSSGGGSESPSTSMEQMGGVGANSTTATGAASIHPHPQHHHQHQHSHQDSFHGSIGGSSNASFWSGSAPTGQMARHWNFESDEEDDLINEADWSSNVAAEILATLTDAEKKRQEIINEIYQTERSHVRTLKLLERLFFYPLQESGLLTQDHLHLLFPPSLLSLCDLHGSFEQKIKQRRIDNSYIVNNIGDLLAGMFDGKSGEELREFAAQFCARQQIALEALKEKRRKDDQLQKLLSKAESHKACRRLQLKDLLPTVLQRLTKYPLLFENLHKVTVRVVPEDVAEAEAIQKALESSKKILVDVNQAVKTAEDAHKLQNIQRKLDKSTFDKEKDKDEFRNLDLTQYRLIHDGSLTMKKNPSVQLYGLLFETMIVLLTKLDDKYSLKYLHAARNTEVNNKGVCPVMSIDSETLVRQEAADKNSFFLIKTKSSQMLELRAPSSSECKTWFKHISDAAEQYKPRSKNTNHEHIDDPAIATLPHSNTRESLELTPERMPPQSATATVITTPLAPIMPMPSVNNERSGFGSHPSDVQLRNGRRESTPTSVGTASDSYPPYYNMKQRLSHNELSANASAVNRTMSTRSCGDAYHNYSNTGDFAGANGVTLRHTQSARQANGSGEDNAAGSVSNKRDSASIVYSNNSNNTRTLMQSSPPLVEPTAIQISISPAHTAEPVLTPAEKLRRLDASIRDGLLEKQKIICDMFRLPVEHFHEIVDIAAMPEAPKDSTDIALAAYAQVQSLTEVINEYMKVTPEQEVSAVSTAVCDKCHEKQQQNRQRLPPHNVGKLSVGPDVPPPLPPPNKQTAQAQQQTPAPTATKIQMCALEETNIHEDDDGYCEIDELRLPALPPLTKTTSTPAGIPPPTPPITKTTAAMKGSPPPPLPPPAGSFKSPPPPPPPPVKSTAAPTTCSSISTSTTPELIKRQSTISADSIPEESTDDLTNALADGASKAEEVIEDGHRLMDTPEEPPQTLDKNNTNESLCDIAENVETTAPIATIDDEEDKEDDSAMHTAECESISVDDKSIQPLEADGKPTTPAIATENELSAPMIAEPQRQNSNATQADDLSLGSEHVEVNQAFECLAMLNNLTTVATSMVDSSTQTLSTATISPICSGSNASTLPNATGASSNGHLPTPCGPNRVQHANSLEPSVPCYALSSIVSSLNAQISLLLPKINERDMERERLRKENQHLRELLNAMHERQRVESKLETPCDITTSAEMADNEMDVSSPTTSTTPTPTPVPVNNISAQPVGEDENKTAIGSTDGSVEAQN
uniref:DH domain-containing protein n=1 Tax=Stomoxys calcitrans TaxID=35570 RepID=A0A1I8P3A6_STOCA